MSATIPNHLFTQNLPAEHLPGSDRISKMILKTQTVIDLIANDLLDTPNGTYTFADADWNGPRSDILYIPRLASQKNLPAILVEIQQTVDASFLQRLISYSLNVSKVYKTLPIVLVLCTRKISPSGLLLDFASFSDSKHWLRSIPCLIWAKRCYLVANETIPHADLTLPLNPLLALSIFMLERQPSLHLNSYPLDPTIIQLYEIAFSLVPDDHSLEKKMASSLETICNTNNRLWKRVHETVTGVDKDKIKRICERGLEYNKEVKYRLLGECDISEEELEYPDEPPLSYQKKTSLKHTMSNQDIKYVEDFKAIYGGRMNWKLCLKLGQERSLLENYNSSESLRVTYSNVCAKNKKK